jgi:Family of unknown function (DUF5994)
LARPVRLSLAEQLGADIDGAWWPHTASVADELPELVGALHRPLGEIIDICINWSATEGPLDLNTIVTGARLMHGAQHRRPRLMVVAGRNACAKLLVVPYMTSQALGVMVMRCAAAMPASESDRDTQLFETAHCVMCAAQAESVKWTGRMHDIAVTESLAVQNFRDADSSPGA